MFASLVSVSHRGHAAALSSCAEQRAQIERARVVPDNQSQALAVLSIVCFIGSWLVLFAVTCYKRATRRQRPQQC